MLAEMIFIVLSTELMSFDYIVRCCINIGVSIFGPIDLLVAQSANPLPDGLHGSLSALDLHDLIDHPASDSVYEVEGFGFTISQISHTLRSRSQVSYPILTRHIRNLRLWKLLCSDGCIFNLLPTNSRSYVYL